jgi:hypothetical protein
MPTFAQSAFGQLRYMAEVTPGLTPVAGNGSNLRMTGPTAKASIATTKSDEISSDRLAPGSIRTDLNIDGGFNFEFSGREYDPFLEGLMGTSMVHYGTNGFGATFTATTAASTITAAVAPTGTSAFTNIGLAQWIKLVPPVGSSQAIKDYFADTWFKTHASTPSTTTVITLDAATPIVAPGLVTTIAGYCVSQSVILNGSVFKTFSLEYAMTDINEFMIFKGMRPGSLDLDISVGSIIKGSFGFMGMTHASTTVTGLPGTPTASNTLDPLSAVTDVGSIYEGATSLLANGSFIKSVKLSVNNSLRGQKAIQTFGNAGVGYGELAISGQMEVYFPDASYYRKWLNGTNTALSFGMSDALGNGYMFDFDKVTFRDVALNPGGRNDDVMLTLPFDCYRNGAAGAAGSRAMRITRGVSA